MESFDSYELGLSLPTDSSTMASCNLAGFDNSLGGLSIDWQDKSSRPKRRMDPSVTEFCLICSAINLALRIMEQDNSLDALADIGLDYLDQLGRGSLTAYRGGTSRSRMRLYAALFLAKLRSCFVNVQITSDLQLKAQAVLKDWGSNATEYDAMDAGVLRLNARVSLDSNRFRLIQHGIADSQFSSSHR